MDSAILVQNIKLRCKANGVAPTVACKDAGVGGSFINDIERGQVPSVGRVQQLATYLGCTVSELLGEAPPGQQERLAAAIVDFVKPDFLIKFESLSPEDQEEVIAIIEMKAARKIRM